MSKTTINNVLVFDGESVTGPQSVHIDNGTIQSDGTGGEVVDGTGCMLLPGLIDGHIHIQKEADLHACAKHGITTVCDLGAYPKECFEQLKAVRGTTDYFASGLAAFPPGGMHAHMYPAKDVDVSLKGGVDAVDAWIDARIAEKVDFIKVIGDDPGFDQETLNKLAAAAKAHGKLSILHASSVSAYKRGLIAGFDMLTHVPNEGLLDDETIREIADKGVPVSPTIFIFATLMASPQYVSVFAKDSSIEKYLQNVTNLHKAGVTMLTGTDSVTGMVDYGSSIHEEMAMLVKAGLTPVETLTASTSGVASFYKMTDRGRIAAGLKADLVLVEGDPSKNIDDSKKIKMVWKDGVKLI